jgi:hypothetical protein
MRENVRRKRSDKWRNNSWVLRHNNAPVHPPLVVQTFLAYTKTTAILLTGSCLLYFFFLFPKMKLKLKWRRCDSPEECQIESQDALKTLTQNDLQQCFRSWKSRRDRCINAEGNYFEGDKGEQKCR